MSESTNGTHRTLTHWGAFEVDSFNGQIVAARDLAEGAAPSALGVHLLSRSHNRVARPAVRASWLEHGAMANPHLRGSEPHIEVSWTEALDLAHAAIARTKSDFGSESIFAGSYGWGSAGRFHHAQSQLKRFLNCIGGFITSHGTYSHGAAEVAVQRILGLNFAEFQRSLPAANEIAHHTELFVSFGGFPASNSQIVSGGDLENSSRQTLQTAAERGCQFVSIAPTFSDLDAALGAQWLPIRPGTDAALLIGLSGELVNNDRYDREFLATYCSGSEHLLDYLRGKRDGVVKDAQWSSEICDISPAKIVELAHALTTHKSLVNATWSTQRVEHGEQAFWAQIALVALLGQMGTTGAGLSFGYGSMGSVGAPSTSTRLASLPQGANGVNTSIPVARIADALEQPGALYRFNGTTNTYPHIDLIYWCGGNPFHHHQDLNRLDGLWRRPRAVIVNEPFWSATAERADIVFPTTIGTERADIGGASTGGHLIAMSQAVPPFAEAKDDHDIFTELAARFGVEDVFTEQRTPAEWMRWIYDQSRERAPGLPTYEHFLERGIVARPADETPRMLAEFLDNPTTSPLRTNTGRIALAFEHLDEPDAVMHPEWHTPAESLVTAAPEQFHLVTPMPASRLHSQYSSTGSAAELKIHPKDIESLQLENGASVRVHNDRGAFLAKLRADHQIRRGVVSAENGLPLRSMATPDGLVCTGGNVNVMTQDRPTSSWAQATTAHCCLVEIGSTE